jgi:dynactin complex subunit
MSRIPDNLKSKYNHDDKFRWVDSQLEKFMKKQKELEEEIKYLKKENKYLKKYFRIDRSSKNED